MKISGKKAVALASAFAISAVSLGVVGSASAKTYTKSEYINRDKCYIAKRIPATVQYNTRGVKLRDASRSWVGNAQRHGAKIIDKYHDPVYMQTRTVVEDQHVTLVPSKC
ncbi:MAG: hypothetical protein KDJ63_06335 [Nitratireductor sp.]|nr:hypothetical protein [Nitratireductor sp.]